MPYSTTGTNNLTTALIADAGIRLGVPIRHAPPALRPFVSGQPLIGGVRPARHAGSVDVFLEALELAEPGEILVIDDGGRTDRACIGDLTALEVMDAGLAGIIVWGSHRDGAELQTIGLPVFSLGAHPAGPSSVEPRHPEALTGAQIADHLVSADDLVVADDDGVLFLSKSDFPEIAKVANEILLKERAQAAAVRSGINLRNQLQFKTYLETRHRDPAYGFRAHLRRIGGAIEE